MKKQYEKPMFTAIEIQLNDLCVGSKQTSANLHILEMKGAKERIKFKHSYQDNGTKDMWRNDF